jgi:hypothetical protein
MNQTTQQIMAMLARKQQIVERIIQTNRMESDHQWLVDAVELLLRIELERQS